MKRRVRSRASAGLVSIACVCWSLACSALGPAGRGGWSAERRTKELEHATTLASPARPLGAGLESAATPQPFVSGAPAGPARLDFATALDLAARHNRNIAASEASVEAAAGGVAVARAALLPQATVRGSFNWYTDPQANTVDPDNNPATPPIRITIREQDFASISAAVHLAIDLSGELRHGLYSAQASYRAESARAWATRLQEESAVADAYFGLLEAERLREVGNETLALHERQLADSSSRFEQGRLTKNGVLVVEVAVTDARQALQQLDNAVEAARRSLNATTGLEIAAPTTVYDVSGPPMLPSLDEAVGAVTSRNPLVLSMLEEAQAADERLTAARRGRFPRFSATGGYDATTQDTIQPNNYGSVGVGMELDLGSFAREGEIERLEAGAKRSRFLLDKTRRDVETLVRNTYDRVRERVAAIDAATEAVAQAEENRRIREVQFDEGRATSEDLLDASQLLTRQRAALASAVYQAHVRRAELQQLMGEPLASLAAAHGANAGRADASKRAGAVPDSAAGSDKEESR